MNKYNALTHLIYQNEKYKKVIGNVSEFINEYPGYDKEPDFVGRKAYIYTLNDDILINNKEDGRYNFLKKDGYLTGEWSSSFLPLNCKKAEIKIKITEDMVCKVEDNSWVNENTKFAD